MLRSCSLSAGLLAAALLAGCAGMQPPGAPAAGAVPTPLSSVGTRPYHEAIELGGRLSLRYELRNQPQSLDGKFTWNQTTGLTHISLLTPFGQTLATIDVTPQLSTLLQPGQPARTEADVDTLLAGTLGWPLPVAGLRDWLQGFARDEHGQPYVASKDAVGDAAYVKTADGWLIHYPVWDDADANANPAPAVKTLAAIATQPQSRPKRIDLQRTTSQAGNVQLRIVIDQWQPH